MINPSLLTSDKPLKVKVGKTESGFTKLIFSDRQQVEVSQKYLPKGVAEGESLFLNLLTESELDLTRREIAKKVLDDILSQG